MIREPSSAATPSKEGPAAAVERVIAELVRELRAALGEDLVSVVLFGSAAEGRLRATSDVNVMVVLRAFEPTRLDAVRNLLRADRAAVGLSPMFLLQAEIDLAARAFPVKLADIARRRKVVFGPDLFEGLSIPREAEAAHLRQGLFNLLLRLRAAYVERSLREEQLALAVAGAAGPLRALAAALLELEGKPAPTGKEALARVAAEANLPDATEVLTHISEAREERALPAGVASRTMMGLLALVGAALERAEKLSEGAR